MKLHFNDHLTIGFAGKRNHGKLESIQGKLAALFKAFETKLKCCHMHFITGLADGADQIAAATFASAFTAEIATNTHSLEAVLPFSKDEYFKTISDQESYERLLGLCNRVLELDGRYEKVHAADRTHEKAYQQQGRVLGRISDIFIAVAPKSEQGKTGGTMESLVFALTLNKPVILLNLTDNQFYLYRNIEEWFGQGALLSEVQLAEALFSETSSPSVFELDEISDKGFVFKARRQAWIWFEKILKGRKQVSSSYPETVANSLHERLLGIKKTLDGLATHYQYQYRGGYILNYILALSAIFLAILSSVLLSERPHIEEIALTYMLMFLGALKITIIAMLIFNTKNINKNEYNRMAIDYRYAAERTRINCFLSLLGVLRSPYPSLGNHSKKHFANYTGESIYQASMAAPLLAPFRIKITTDQLKLSVAALSRDYLAVQRQYHSNESRRMKKMDDRLERLPELFSYAVVIIVLLDLAGGYFVDIPGNHPYNWLRISFPYLVPVMLGLTAFLPAIINTLNSIHFQSEARRLFVRSDLMVKELAAHDEKIQHVTEIIERNPGGSDFNTVFNLMENVAGILTDEVAEWSMIYEKRVYDQ